jgi:hypothetical protein
MTGKTLILQRETGSIVRGTLIFPHRCLGRTLPRRNAMADYDPNRLDPNRPDSRRTGLAAGPGMNWNWILGGVAVVVVLLIALSYMGGDSTRTADTPSATTTGQGMPKSPPATTGQSSPTQSGTPNAAPTIPNSAPNPSPAPKQ